MKATWPTSALTLAMLLASGTAFSQTGTTVQDPGVQTAARQGADCGGCALGGPLSSVAANNPPGILAFFNDGLARFQVVEAVSGTKNNGLGPRFNSNSCSSCHAQPAVGGSGANTNPQFLFPTDGVAPGNTIPSFITANGPTREARFPYFFVNGAVTMTVSGNVEDIFTVSGRSDAGTCTTLEQPPFAAALAAGDVIFRIPTPVFGAGLVENLDDSTLLINQQNNLNNNFGITGTFNHNGNDGTISRFGWKAQNKSMHIFAGEAYNVEMGISNLLFQNERPGPEEDNFGTGLPSGCLNLSGSGYPEDASNPNASPDAAVLDDVSAFANFMRTLAPPAPGNVVLNGVQVSAQSIATGAQEFAEIGCATCHNSSLGLTQPSNITPSLGSTEIAPFSDFEIHDMGTTLADNIMQGGAGGNQFRTAPLWGLGQRIFLEHDGRRKNLLEVIADHSSSGSEASQSVANFGNLNSTLKQDVLNFLRSL